MGAAPREARQVFDLNRGHRPYHTAHRRLAEDVGRQELAQRLDPVEHARGPVGANRDARSRHREPISLLAEPRQGWIEAQGNHARGTGRGAADRQPIAGRRPEPVGHLVADLPRGAIGRHDGGRCEKERAGPASHMRGPRDHGEGSILDCNERDEREEVDHADMILLARVFCEP